ncbi:MAG TPA: histidinol-phosphatase [Burkholderiaceae bacterium]|nr:histidinol-phosphatase [Burkholderiaceae bacterium]
MPEHETFTAIPDQAERAELVPFARELAVVAAAVIRQHYLTGAAIVTKEDDSPVTIADRRAEEVMRALILHRYPDHGILGEEFGEHRPDATYRWVLDPIDGTKSFVSNSYLFGTLIALLRNGRPILGVIASPLVGHVLVGTGDSASLGERPVRVRPCARLEDATLLTSDHRHVAQYQDGPAFDALVQRVKLYRTWGDCHGYLLVATGGADAMVDPVLSPWDIMALIPVIEGAGGRITDWHGGDPVGGDSIVATGGPIHDALLQALRPQQAPACDDGSRST